MEVCYKFSGTLDLHNGGQELPPNSEPHMLPDAKPARNSEPL